MSDKLFFGCILFVCVLGVSLSLIREKEEAAVEQKVLLPVIKTKVGKDSVYVVFGTVVKQLYDSNLKTNRIIIERK